MKRSGNRARALPIKQALTAEQSDLAVSFYDAAIDYSRESFEMIAKRIVPKGFGKLKS
jgi:hypothetical protein